MVQIKDSVLRDSGVPPGCFPASSRYAHLHDAAPALRCDMSAAVRDGKDVRTAFSTPDDDSDCQQLVNNLSRELYVVDFRRVVRGSKKVRIFRKTGLTFQKVVQGIPKQQNDTACKLKTRRSQVPRFSRGNLFAPVICGSLCRSVRTGSGRFPQGPPAALSTSFEKQP